MRGGQKAAAQQLVTQFSQADLVERINVGRRCNQSLVPVKMPVSLNVNRLANRLSVEIRVALKCEVGVRGIDNSKRAIAAYDGHGVAAAVIDDEIASEITGIGERAAVHVQHGRRTGGEVLTSQVDYYRTSDVEGGITVESQAIDGVNGRMIDIRSTGQCDCSFDGHVSVGACRQR